MADNFKKTVNLKQPAAKTRVSRADQLDKIYDDYQSNKNDGQKINRPVAKKVNDGLVKRIVFILAILILAFVAYWLFFAGNNNEKELATAGWYSVRLVDGQIFYGQIKDIKANPLELSKVYYNYDQAQSEDNKIDETGNLRLVKRGQETHGPAGEMYIYQDRVEFVEPLKEDSKVLKAILNYEQ